MKRLTTLLVVSIAMNVAMCQTDAQEHGPPPIPELTEHHKELHKDVGVWEGEMKMWMAPGAEPMSMPIKETNRLMTGDMWIISEFDSGPFQGRGQFGYDHVKKEYVGTWIDNMSTHLGVMRGNKNDKGELEMYSTGYNPHTQEEEEMKSVSKYVSDDERHFTMYKKPKGSDDWQRVFVIEYRRSQS